uniref:Uncharacterized protein n=1 Tax=Caenorhabditis japonica TaxID=281687 RepID=A0A8R1INH7_CAEJA
MSSITSLVRLERTVSQHLVHSFLLHLSTTAQYYVDMFFYFFFLLFCFFFFFFPTISIIDAICLSRRRIC